jgi:DNA-directed RNA polymerase alpha subunit
LRNNQLTNAYFAFNLLVRAQKRAAGKKKWASQSEMQLSSTKNVQEDSPEEISQKYQRVFQAKSSGLKVGKREQKAAPQLR